jgi:SPP1 gp7 family putative phage head morphogenesis protein
MCQRCLAASFRPKTDPTHARKIEARYEKLLVGVVDEFETAVVTAFEAHARELAAPTVDVDLDWLRTWLDQTIAELMIKPVAGPQSEIIKIAYRQGATWADTAIAAISIGGKIGAGPIDWRALDILKARNTSAFKGVADELGKHLITALTEGLMQGEGIPKLSARIRDRVQAIGRTRAETIARTETMYAVNEGSKIRYAQAGITKVKILVGLDERTCDECEPLHGNVYDIGDEPQLPIHPRCRCCYSPVVEVPK